MLCFRPMRYAYETTVESCYSKNLPIPGFGNYNSFKFFQIYVTAILVDASDAVKSYNVAANVAKACYGAESIKGTCNIAINLVGAGHINRVGNNDLM